MTATPVALRRRIRKSLDAKFVASVGLAPEASLLQLYSAHLASMMLDCQTPALTASTSATTELCAGCGSAAPVPDSRRQDGVLSLVVCDLCVDLLKKADDTWVVGKPDFALKFTKRYKTAAAAGLPCGRCGKMTTSTAGKVPPKILLVAIASRS